MTVLLVTSAELPTGEPGAPALDDALDRRGIDARWVAWDDPSVDWVAADLVAVRSPWDYHTRAGDFLAWARNVPRLLNGAAVFAWNHDKAYLAELYDAGAVPGVPTRLAATHDEFASAIAQFGPTVVKPRVSAGGVGLMVVESADDARLGAALSGGEGDPGAEGPWIAQPVVASVRTVGEMSLYLLGGRVSAQFRKLPAVGELRVNEEYGGVVRRVAPDPEVVTAARGALAWAEERLARRLDYARIDLLHHDGHWAVGELELIEPGLYLDVDPGHAEAYAELVADRLAALE